MNSDATEAALGLLGLSPSNLQPPAVVPLKRKQSNLSLTTPIDENSAEAIKCICGFTYDDGFSIACDDCSRWCHAACFDIVEGEVPEEWRCWECVPRVVDRERATRLQRARQRQTQERTEIERQRRRSSPGVDRKQRRASAAGMDGNSKRKRRMSINAEDEQIDVDEPCLHSYVHISADIVPHHETRDRLRRQAQRWRGITALAPGSPLETAPVRLAEESLTSPPPTTLQPLPESSFSHPTLSLNTNPSVRPPSYAMHTAIPIPSDHLIAPYRSTITPSSAYLSDPLNAYAHLGMPKPFVHLLGSPLDLALDARITGDKSRFVRSGCKPNAVLRPILCARSTNPSSISFGVFALRNLKANEEVILGWEWDDGNAVHSLPALIQTPHLFQHSCCQNDSPRQLEHLRNQMSNILHALSSTFTTCACGSSAKDCALTQMAAFVDGDIPSPPVDLGPLVGVKRGFRTREKVPHSGGMSGVEMCNGKENEDPVDDHPRNTKKLPKQRLTVQTTPAPEPPPRPPELNANATDDSMEVEEDKMPPKMRKQWIHRSAEALKDHQAHSSESPSSVVSLGSPMSIGIRISEAGDSERDIDREHTPPTLNTHHSSPSVLADQDYTDMPPPPMPAALDPTTISSISARPSPSTEHRTATSPSTSFAKLSLLSPVIPPPTTEPASPPVPNGDSDSEHKVRFASSACSDLPPSLERRTEDKQDDSLPPPSAESEPVVPPPPSPPAQPAKVKMSLKDFALRKKRLREMAKSRAESSPNGQDVHMDQPMQEAKPVDVSLMEANEIRTEPPSLDAGVHEGEHEPQPSERREQQVEEGNASEHRIVQEAHEQPTDPSAYRVEQQPIELDSTETLAMEPVQSESPDVSPDEQPPDTNDNHLEPPSITRPNGKENEWMKVEVVECPLETKTCKDDIVRSRSRSTSPRHGRLPSQEDGEIMSSRSDTPPLRAKAQAQVQMPVQGFVPRSHTPPTQPRSFHTSASPTPSAPLNRRTSLGPPSYVRSPVVAGGVNVNGRPLPSGPRALRTAHAYQTAARPPVGGPPPYIPRGPSADRDRMDWERERGWIARRGRGGTWGR